MGPKCRSLKPGDGSNFVLMTTRFTRGLDSPGICLRTLLFLSCHYFLPGKLYLYDLRGNRMLLYFYFVTIFTFIKPLSGKGRIPLSHRVRSNRRWPSITQFEWQFVQDTNLFNSVFRFWCSCRLDIYCQSLSFNAMILIQRYSKLSNNRTGRIPN